MESIEEIQFQNQNQNQNQIQPQWRTIDSRIIKENIVFIIQLFCLNILGIFEIYTITSKIEHFDDTKTCGVIAWSTAAGICDILTLIIGITHLCLTSQISYSNFVGSKKIINIIIKIIVIFNICYSIHSMYVILNKTCHDYWAKITPFWNLILVRCYIIMASISLFVLICVIGHIQKLCAYYFNFHCYNCPNLLDVMKEKLYQSICCLYIFEYTSIQNTQDEYEYENEELL
jgi:hypothetical protein